MCPVCMATAAWIAAAAISTGGMTALVLKKAATGNAAKQSPHNFPIEGGSPWLAPRQELQHPKVVSHTEWLAARKDFLKKEKEFTHLRDELSRQRRGDCPGKKSKKIMCSTDPAAK